MLRKSVIFCLSALALICAATASGRPQQQEAPKQYLVGGVAFYNLENLFDTINNNGRWDLEFSPEGARAWNSDKYWKKVSNMARAIAALSTDVTPLGPGVIGVSEVENRSVLEDLVARIDSELVSQGREPWGLQIVHHDSPDRRGVDVALLYNPLYFTLENVNNHTLRIDHDPDFRTRDQLVVSGQFLESPLTIVVNHWPSRLGGQDQSEYLRVAAGELSRHIADSVMAANPGSGVIIMGDLNDDPKDKSCSVALGAVRERENLPDSGLYNPFWYILDNGVGTLCYRGVWNLFDQIVVNGSLVNAPAGNLQYWKATVHNMPMLRTKSGKYKNYPHRTFSGGRFLNGYSDHFPTQIFLVREVLQQ